MSDIKYRWASAKRILRVLPLALLGLQMIFAAYRGAAAAERRWSTEEVGRGITSSISLDSSSNLHIVYLTDQAKLMYGFQSSHGGKWYTVGILDSTHTIQNVYPRIAADQYDRPHVCVAIGALEYITLNQGRWATQEIDPGSGTLSYHCSIALASDGTPHIAWYHEFLPGGKQFTHFRHADLENGAWVVRSVDGGISGKWNSMAIDADGQPHVAYSQWASTGDIRYGAWDGKSWNIETIVKLEKDNKYRGYDNGIVLAKDGSPRISYFDENNLMYARRTDGKWKVDKVSDVSEQFDFYHGSTSLLLDHEGLPHIIYGDVGSVKHAFWDGQEWKVETVASGAVGQYGSTDAAIGSDDTLYVSYPDPEDGMVKVAIGKIIAAPQEAKK